MTKIKHAARLVLPLLMSGLASAQTATTVSQTINFGPVGLGATETAQITVFNSAPASSAGAAASCTGSIAFENTSGTTIGSATPFTLGTGQVASATLPYSSAGASGRAVTVGVVTLTRSTASPVAPCILRSMLETYDASGTTHVHLSGNEVAVPVRVGFGGR